MKKKKLTGLHLNKKTISKLQSSQIMGGNVTYDNGRTCNGDCNLVTKRKACGSPTATQAYTCTVRTIHMTNCDAQVCLSAGACA